VTYTGQLVTGSVVLLIYLMVMLFAASNYIRRANGGWLKAHEAALQGRLQAGTGKPGEIDAAIKLLLKRDTPARRRRRRFRLRSWLRSWLRERDTERDTDRGSRRDSHPDADQNSDQELTLSPAQWIGSCEIARWVRLHEAQRLEVSLLSDVAVRARFARAMGQIEELPAVRQSAWQRRWVELQNASAQPAGSRDESAEVWKAELSQLLAELFNARDSTYNQLVSLYGKAGWLVTAAYLPVAALLVSGYGQVLLAGFLGGLVSRMQRLVYGRGRPTAYGASWVPLFLAPLLGALAAWAGLHLLVLMQGLGIVDLKGVLPPFTDFRLTVPPSVVGLAVLLGFSERLFNQLGDQADKVLSGDPDTSSPAAAGSPAAPLPTTSLPGPREPFWTEHAAGQNSNGAGADASHLTDSR
jgi:hypothetical protein